MSIVNIASFFLIAHLLILVAQYFVTDSEPWLEGLADGTIAVSLYLFSIYHFFTSGIIWLGVVSIIFATIVVIRNLI